MSSRAAAGNQNLKNLRIKTGSCKRLLADLKIYGQEEKQQTEKIAKMKADGADAYDIKQQENVLADTMQVIPDTTNRLNAAYVELISCIELCTEDETVNTTDVWTDALKMKETLEPMFE